MKRGSTPLWRWWGVSGMSVVALGLEPTAHAQPTWLSWTSPDECPTGADIERRVAELLGGPVPSDQLRVRAKGAPQKDRWVVDVEVTLARHTGKRRVTVSSCEQAADFVAVAIALVIDPEVKDEADTEGAFAREPSEQPAEQSSPKPPREARPPEATRTTSPLRPKDNSNLSFRPFVDLAGEGALQPLPGVAWGGNPALGVNLGSIWFGAGVRWLPRSTVTLSQAIAPLDFSLFAGRVVGGYLWHESNLRTGPIISGEAGLVFVDERGAAPQSTEQPWFAIGAGGIVMFDITEQFGAFAQLEATVPLTQPRFELNDGTRVHRVTVGGRLAVGARFFLFGQ